MNHLYAINFTPGFEGIVGSVLIKLRGDIIYSEEAFILVKFRGLVDSTELRFAKNIVQVFNFADNFKNLRFDVPADLDFGHSKTFTLRSFEFGRPSKIESSLRTELIEEIGYKTRLKYSAFEPDVDFVVAKRRSGMSYFGVKLNLSEESKLSMGELSSDISNLLLRLGDLTYGAEVLDAFVGYGGISKEILKSFEPLSLVSVDKDSRAVNGLKSKFGAGNRVKVVASDVVMFLKNTEKFFDLIIADPPWGEFEEYEGNLQKLYSEFLVNAGAKLKSGGKVVIISSKKEVLEKAAIECGLNIETKLNVLISGKKVLVLKLGNNG
jgi:tRNA G10  N-methylase Trm11